MDNKRYKDQLPLSYRVIILPDNGDRKIRDVSGKKEAIRAYEVGTKNLKGKAQLWSQKHGLMRSYGYQRANREDGGTGRKVPYDFS
jgi:hypothetical protein